ncbi:CBS domain-containing protein [Candidatus Persebacteraceae bacterium Df01]|jgi:magnesium and cobalt transporter|uniref:CBS domain-containing protein n=1 Tax=Candidatus Doriopsillibacter californiensis TaxID=2970740 RepID=A0ABT7QNC0_9GAMM|nr:CBS domain-containing protein [Candidatus Persebacteraceae bacterium Df01]
MNENAPVWRKQLLRLFGTNLESKQALLEHLRNLQHTNNFFDEREMEMIEGVLSMDKWEIRDVMIAKNDIVGLSVNDTYERAVDVVRKNAHSRYPVFENDGDHVCGIFLAKDLIRYIGAPENFSLRRTMRKPVFESVSRRLDTLLEVFLKRQLHMVVAIDEHELPAGIVTIEDVLEKIVGEIQDEFDDEDDEPATSTPDGAIIIKGAMSVEEFNAQLNADFPEDGADTIAGWLAAELGHLPAAGYRHTTHGWLFEVIEADDRRIYTLKVISADVRNE